MSPSQKEQAFYGDDVGALSRSEAHAVNRIADASGDVVMTCHQVFPGIELIYKDIHTSKCVIAHAEIDDVIEINHCREGRIEGEFQDEYFYLTAGDLSISSKQDAGHSSSFPLGHYHGITIVIDLQKAPDCLSCLLDDVNVRPSAMLEKFCSENSCFVARSKPYIAHIFSELYAVPERIQKGYFKVKILELLLFLSSIEPDENETKKRCLPKTQVDLAKEVSLYLAGHMDQRVTIAQLAEHFAVSQTVLKTSFKGVYGVSVYAYIREQKMQMAALWLKKTDRSVLEIAGQCGYDNASKFASAFRAVIGASPIKYRMQERRADHDQ